VETKYALWMRKTGVRQLTVVINKTGCAQARSAVHLRSAHPATWFGDDGVVHDQWTKVGVEGSCGIMFMTACLHGSFLPGDSTERVQVLINEVMTSLKPGNPWLNMDVGETAELYFAPQIITHEMFDEPPFDAGIRDMLVVSVNRITGFGALRWNFAWVAHNPDPPVDPRVIGDPGFPRCITRATPCRCI